MITPKDAEWPSVLMELGGERPPDRLFVEGQPLLTGPHTIAIVGSRRPTVAGVEISERIARGLAEAGFGIVSGLAVGIDSVAHRAALDSGGYTVAVLGCGLNVDYPQRNRSLKSQIRQRGTLLTEYESDTEPHPGFFPRRNRIVAGISSGVVFVEGGLRSGGLITARLALEANRAVFAVPGSVRNPMADGPNALIRSAGAALITGVQDILEELAPGTVWEEPYDPSLARAAEVLGETERRVLGSLDDVPIAVETLAAGMGLQAGEAMLALSRLEARGLAVRRLAGYEITGGGGRVRRALSPN